MPNGVNVSEGGYVVLTFRLRKEGRLCTACCEELGTAVFGRSLPEADKRLSEAVSLYLNTLEEVGECERFFEKHDIELHHIKPEKDITVCLPLTTEIFVHPHIQSVRGLSAV